jgi:predicted metal-binding membrane protein
MMNTAHADTVPRAGGHDIAFFGTVALVFTSAAVLTIHGGQSMSMPWMRMPGQTWPGVAAGFIGMWIAMMVAMMLPSQVPLLWRYRRALHGAGETRSGALITVMSLGYFAVWSAAAVPVFALGVALAAIPARIPTTAVVLLISGLLQLTRWKAEQLACCRAAPGHDRTVAVTVGAAWRYGLRHGIHCGYCCAGPTAVLMAVGVMDLRAMALSMSAITAERLLPEGQRLARAIGIACIVAGLVLIQRSCA